MLIVFFEYQAFAIIQSKEERGLPFLKQGALNIHNYQKNLLCQDGKKGYIQLGLVLERQNLFMKPTQLSYVDYSITLYESLYLNDFTYVFNTKFIFGLYYFYQLMTSRIYMGKIKNNHNCILFALFNVFLIAILNSCSVVNS